MFRMLALILNLFLQITLVTSATDCSGFPIQSIDQLPQPYLPVDTTYYRKFVMANGLPILASSSVNDNFLKDAARSLKGFTDALQPQLLHKLQQNRNRLMIYAKHETICAIPEVNKGKRCNQTAYGLTFNPVSIFKEEWTKERCGMGVMFHEFAHAINGMFSKELQDKLKAAYNSAKASGLYNGKYGMSSAGEYFAEVRSWFADGYDCVLGPTMCTKNDFERRDPKYAAFIKHVFPGHQWTNRCEDVCGTLTQGATTMQEFVANNQKILAVKSSGVRLSNHYNNINRNSEASCWNSCLVEWSNGCRATSFVTSERKGRLVYNCYLYKDNYNKGTDQGWSSYISADSQQIEAHGSVKNHRRLSNHYTQLQTTTARMCFEFCKKDRANGCLASAFVNKQQVQAWRMPENCFLYKRGYENKEEHGWTSYFINH